MKTRLTGSAPAAFTLLEMLAVVALITVLLGMTLSISRYVSHRARMAQAAAQMTALLSALEEYRADHGEYPVTGDPRHYPTSYDIARISQSAAEHTPWKGLNLATGDTHLEFGQTVTNAPAVGSFADNYIDFSLTYPLVLGRKELGKQPYLKAPEEPVCHLAYSYKSFSDQHTSYKTVDAKGTAKYYLVPKTISMPKITDPITGKQLRYESTDGLSYNIKTNDF